MSFELADILFYIFSAALIVGTIGTIALDRHKERVSNEKISALNNQTEVLKANNLELERILTPRRWVGPSVRGAVSAGEVFHFGDMFGLPAAHPKIKALIQCVPDFETQRLAADIFYNLKMMGWDIKESLPTETGVPYLSMSEGVEIWSPEKPDDAWEAAEALKEAMIYEGIRAADSTREIHFSDPRTRLWQQGDIRKNMPKETVIIFVGPRPALYELWSKQFDRERENNVKK